MLNTKISSLQTGETSASPSFPEYCNSSGYSPLHRQTEFPALRTPWHVSVALRSLLGTYPDRFFPPSLLIGTSLCLTAVVLSPWRWPSCTSFLPLYQTISRLCDFLGCHKKIEAWICYSVRFSWLPDPVCSRPNVYWCRKTGAARLPLLREFPSTW